MPFIATGAKLIIDSALMNKGAVNMSTDVIMNIGEQVIIIIKDFMEVNGPDTFPEVALAFVLEEGLQAGREEILDKHEGAQRDMKQLEQKQEQEQQRKNHRQQRS